MLKYVFWSGLTALGGALAFADWRGFRRPWSGLALFAAFLGGYAMTAAFPSDADVGMFMTGVMLAIGSAFALSGYVVVALGWVIQAELSRLRKRRKARSS
jgi:hypothetical protein